jgi:hypothetical protein
MDVIEIPYQHLPKLDKVIHMLDNCLIYRLEFLVRVGYFQDGELLTQQQIV